MCAGWSEALLVAHTTLLEIPCHGLICECEQQRLCRDSSNVQSCLSIRCSPKQWYQNHMCYLIYWIIFYTILNFAAYNGYIDRHHHLHVCSYIQNCKTRVYAIYIIIIWASTRENLSSGRCKQQRRRPACASAEETCLSIAFKLSETPKTGFVTSGSYNKSTDETRNFFLMSYAVLWSVSVTIPDAQVK